MLANFIKVFSSLVVVRCCFLRHKWSGYRVQIYKHLRNYITSHLSSYIMFDKSDEHRLLEWNGWKMTCRLSTVFEAFREYLVKVFQSLIPTSECVHKPTFNQSFKPIFIIILKTKFIFRQAAIVLHSRKKL